MKFSGYFGAVCLTLISGASASSTASRLDANNAIIAKAFAKVEGKLVIVKRATLKLATITEGLFYPEEPSLNGSDNFAVRIDALGRYIVSLEAFKFKLVQKSNVLEQYALDAVAQAKVFLERAIKSQGGTLKIVDDTTSLIFAYTLTMRTGDIGRGAALALQEIHCIDEKIATCRMHLQSIIAEWSFHVEALEGHINLWLEQTRVAKIRTEQTQLWFQKLKVSILLWKHMDSNIYSRTIKNNVALAFADSQRVLAADMSYYKMLDGIKNFMNGSLIPKFEYIKLNLEGIESSDAQSRQMNLAASISLLCKLVEEQLSKLAKDTQEHSLMTHQLKKLYDKVLLISEGAVL